MPGYICQDSLFWSSKMCPITKFVKSQFINLLSVLHIQSTSANLRFEKLCTRHQGLFTRQFERLKNEAFTSWTLQLNSVYVGRLETTETCGQCTTLCQMDPQCKSVIFNGGFKQCSFNYGTEPVQTIALPPVFNFFGIRSSLKTCNTI